MTKTIYLLGAGGHGRVALDTLVECGLQVTGILDMGLKSGEQVFGVKVLGGVYLILIFTERSQIVPAT